MPGIYNGFTGSMRMKAYRWLMLEYEAGRRVKPTRCDVCLQERGVIEPHSEDYSAPYGDNVGRWGLCYRCHMALHCRFRNPESFAFYCRTLAAGDRFQPFFTRNFPQFVREHTSVCTAKIEPVGHVPLPGYALLFAEGAKVNAARSSQPELF